VLEAETAFGTVTSARNSEVIHAGIYYPPGSLRAALCVRGKAQLYDYCASHGVAHRRCGKLVVAANADELPALDRLRATALANGVADLQPLSAAQARALEPALQCHGALLSPSTGIIDSHGLMLALLGDAEQHGLPGLVNLFGIESPGLTACLAIAERVVGMTAAQLHRPDQPIRTLASNCANPALPGTPQTPPSRPDIIAADPTTDPQRTPHERHRHRLSQRLRPQPRKVAEAIAATSGGQLLAIDAEGNLPEGGWEALAAAKMIVLRLAHLHGQRELAVQEVCRCLQQALVRPEPGRDKLAAGCHQLGHAQRRQAFRRCTT